MLGRRLEDTKLGEFPIFYNDLQPGDYWKVLDPSTSDPIDVHTARGRFWGSDPSMYEQNLTGTVWGVIFPNGDYGMLSIHTVREEDDGTISVRPGDGSSNSILVKGRMPDGTPEWHGYIEHGEWRSV